MPTIIKVGDIVRTARGRNGRVIEIFNRQNQPIAVEFPNGDEDYFDAHHLTLIGVTTRSANTVYGITRLPH